MITTNDSLEAKEHYDEAKKAAKQDIKSTQIIWSTLKETLNIIWEKIKSWVWDKEFLHEKTLDILHTEANDIDESESSKAESVRKLAKSKILLEKLIELSEIDYYLKNKETKNWETEIEIEFNWINYLFKIDEENNLTNWIRMYYLRHDSMTKWTEDFIDKEIKEVSFLIQSDKETQTKER